jgi:hypothetical protein
MSLLRARVDPVKRIIAHPAISAYDVNRIIRKVLNQVYVSAEEQMRWMIVGAADDNHIGIEEYRAADMIEVEICEIDGPIANMHRVRVSGYVGNKSVSNKSVTRKTLVKKPYRKKK